MRKSYYWLLLRPVSVAISWRAALREAVRVSREPGPLPLPPLVQSLETLVLHLWLLLPVMMPHYSSHRVAAAGVSMSHPCLPHVPMSRHFGGRRRTYRSATVLDQALPVARVVPFLLPVVLNARAAAAGVEPLLLRTLGIGWKVWTACGRASCWAKGSWTAPPAATEKHEAIGARFRQLQPLLWLPVRVVQRWLSSRQLAGRVATLHHYHHHYHRCLSCCC